ncbi:isocyanide synthase family protein [Streptomyces sp. SID13031]|uniref:isocyanide synthase family protein n=1 Tax=Streptomyces sp. SID13031 TaxID=2706046 RepID=UPI001EF32E55|nr:isocyanide synthase family protein [Streptomyces sp. SID13031]
MDLGQLLASDPMLRLYAAPPGSSGVALDQLTGVACADPLEYFVRPLLRVFRTGLDKYGLLLADAGSPLNHFELDDDQRPTGRVLVTSPSKLTTSGPTAVGLLAEMFGEAAVAELIRAELRFLRPETAELLGADERWAPYVHSVPAADQQAVRAVAELVRSRQAARRRGADLPAPVVRYVGARPPGWARFEAELFHLGGRLVGEESAAQTVGELRGHSLDHAPRNWGDEPATSHQTTLSALRLGDLRPGPLAARCGVRLSARQTDELVDRLVSTAHRSAAALAEKVRRATTDPLERVYEVIQRRPFRAGSRANYQPADVRRDLGATVARGEPLRLNLLLFAVKHCGNRLKAAGPLPDLAELAMLVRIVELAATLRAVYPPGVQDFHLINDGEHYRSHPGAPFGDGLRTLRRYADAVGADFVRFGHIDDLARRNYEPHVLSGHAKLKADTREAYLSIFGGLDVTHDPISTLHRAAAVDPIQNFVPLFRSLVFSVPVPGEPDPRWSQRVFAELYDVGPAVLSDLRAARKEVLLAGWAAALEYLCTSTADAEYGYQDNLVPGSLRFVQRPRPGRAAFGPLSGRSVAPSHATGVIDARGIVTDDFSVALLDQGFVPLHSPLLGDSQPFAMVPATAVTDGAFDLLDTTRLRTR